MTAGPLVAAVGCVVISLLCVWIVDPGARSWTVMATGALWGAAGVLVVGLLRAVVDRRSAERDRRPPQ